MKVIHLTKGFTDNCAQDIAIVVYWSFLLRLLRLLAECIVICISPVCICTVSLLRSLYGFHNSFFSVGPRVFQGPNSDAYLLALDLGRRLFVGCVIRLNSTSLLCLLIKYI